MECMYGYSVGGMCRFVGMFIWDMSYMFVICVWHIHVNCIYYSIVCVYCICVYVYSVYVCGM